MAISSISGPLRRESIEYSAQLNVKSILGQGCRCESPDSHALVRARTRADSGSPSSRIVAAKTHPSSEFRVQGTPSAGPDQVDRILQRYIYAGEPRSSGDAEYTRNAGKHPPCATQATRTTSKGVDEPVQRGTRPNQGPTIGRNLHHHRPTAPRLSLPPAGLDNNPTGRSATRQERKHCAGPPPPTPPFREARKP